MDQYLAAVTVVVRDYDEAIAWYTGALGFALVEDTPMGGGKRWVRVAPASGTRGAALLLARAVDDAQRAAVGNQAGGRVAFFLYTDDFDRDHAAMTSYGVRFVGAPRDEPYGRVVVFEDLYGNRWDFIEPRD
jgi:catechol 2,3-dioxygenase-like lactoylglutathione lyase family enzyme